MVTIYERGKKKIHVEIPSYVKFAAHNHIVSAYKMKKICRNVL